MGGWECRDNDGQIGRDIDVDITRDNNEKIATNVEDNIDDDDDYILYYVANFDDDGREKNCELAKILDPFEEIINFMNNIEEQSIYGDYKLLWCNVWRW